MCCFKIDEFGGHLNPLLRSLVLLEMDKGFWVRPFWLVVQLPD